MALISSLDSNQSEQIKTDQINDGFFYDATDKFDVPVHTHTYTYARWLEME